MNFCAFSEGLRSIELPGHSKIDISFSSNQFVTSLVLCAGHHSV